MVRFFSSLTPSAGIGYCVVLTLSYSASSSDWPQWRGPGRDGVWLENGIVSEFSSGQLPAVYGAPVGSGYSGPTVANRAVYLTSYLDKPKQVEQVHCVIRLRARKLKHVYDCEYMDIGYPLGPRAAVAIPMAKPTLWVPWGICTLGCGHRRSDLEK